MPQDQEKSPDVSQPPPLGKAEADLLKALGVLAGSTAMPFVPAAIGVVAGLFMAARTAVMDDAVKKASEPTREESLAYIKGWAAGQQARPDAIDVAAALSAVCSTQRPGSGDREAVIARAIEVIGNAKDAMRWLGMPVRALDYATPISLLNDPEGQADVLNVLTQLEHGVL